MLSAKLTVNEKSGIIKTEYHVPVDDELRKDVSAMSGFLQGIEERGRAERRKIYLEYAPERLYVRADSGMRRKIG